MSPRLGLLLLAVGAGGCAFGDGEYFATVSARLDAEMVVPPDRALPDGWQKLASGYEVRIDTAVLELEEIALLAGAGEPAPESDDHCHGDHCHGEEPEPDQQAGEQDSTVVLALGGAEIDLLAGDSVELSCEPAACGITSPGEITELVGHVHGIELIGLVRDGLRPPRIAGERPFELAIELAEGDHVELGGHLSLPADREHDPTVTLGLHLHLDSEPLDDVAFGEIDADTLDLAADPDSLAAFLEHLSEVEIEAVVER